MRGVRTVVYNIEGNLTLEKLRDIVLDSSDLPPDAQVRFRVGGQMEGVSYIITIES